MSSAYVNHISECFVKPLHELSPETKQPIHFTPFEFPNLNVNYTQLGLLFGKPKPENQDFCITTLLDDLKHTLSGTLNHFYPLAARLATRKEDDPPSYVIYIDPENSPGVKFIYAKSDATISDILSPTDKPRIVHSFFDLNNAINHDGHTLPLLSIQVTELVDGIFIGCSINHMLADGTSFWHFMASWSEIFKSKEQYHGSISRPPVFKRSNPAINLPYNHHDQFIERYEAPTFKERFFHFSSASVSKLKAKANSECNTNKISSLQAVVALLWRCVTRARKLPHQNKTSCSFMINNRQRLNPPLPVDYFGSPVQATTGTATVGDLMANGLGWAALLLHEAVISYDIKAVEESVAAWVKSPFICKMSQALDPYNVCVGGSPRFDMYGCEFGLGKAIAARSGSMNKVDGKITMYPGRQGGGSMGVEVCLLPEYMMNIGSDEELISALTVD